MLTRGVLVCGGFTHGALTAGVVLDKPEVYMSQGRRLEMVVDSSVMAGQADRWSAVCRPLPLLSASCRSLIDG